MTGFTRVIRAPFDRPSTGFQVLQRARTFPVTSHLSCLAPSIEYRHRRSAPIASAPCALPCRQADLGRMAHRARQHNFCRHRRLRACH